MWRCSFYLDHPDVRAKSLFAGLLGEVRNESDGIWETVRLKAGAKAFGPMTQIVFPPSGRFGFVLDPEDNDEGLVGRIFRELAAPDALEVSEEIIEKTPPMTPTLVRSAPRSYLLRAQNADALARLRAHLMSGALGAPTDIGSAAPSVLDRPLVAGRVPVPVGAWIRATTKDRSELRVHDAWAADVRRRRHASRPCS